MQNEQAQKQRLGTAKADMLVFDWLPRMVHSYRRQDEPNSLTVYSDSDWAGCRESRQLTSGACCFHGDYLIKAFRDASQYSIIQRRGRVLLDGECCVRGLRTQDLD